MKQAEFSRLVHSFSRGPPTLCSTCTTSCCVNMRSAMSHAKSGRKVLLPQNEAERVAVADSLRRLVELSVKLRLQVHLGAPRRGGGITEAGFRLGFVSALDRLAVSVADDEAPFDKAETSPNPSGGSLVPLSSPGGVDTSASLVRDQGVVSGQCATRRPSIHRAGCRNG